MILRCTQRLLKGSGIPLTAEPPPAESVLGEWFANVVPLPLPGRVVVMYTSARTLLTVVAPGRALRTTLPLFCQRLPPLLERMKLPDEWSGTELAALDPLYFARTNDRRVLGSMNDLANAIWYRADEARRFEWLDLDALEMDLADTRLSLLGYSSPARVVAQFAHGVRR